MRSDVVQAQYEELNEIAARFGHQAQRNSELYSRIERSYHALTQGGWEGQGKQAFVDEMSAEILPAMQRLTQVLEEARSVTLQTRAIFQQAEEDAASVFGGGDAGELLTSGNGSAAAAGTTTATAEETASIGSRILAGIESLFDAGRRGFDALVGISDSAVTNFLNQILPHGAPGSKESMTFELKGGATIPGVLVGMPASVKLAGADSLTVSHNPDGTYSVSIKQGLGAGLHENLLGEGDAKVRIGKGIYGVDVGVEGHAMLKGETEVAFKFDPKKPGDMTRMAAFVSSMGVSSMLPIPDAVSVAPALWTLRDNLESVKGGFGGEGKVQVAAALVSSDLLGGTAEGDALLMHGGELRRNELGQREFVRSITGEAGGKANGALGPIQFSDGRRGLLSAEHVQNLDTGATSTKIKLELTEAGERGLKLEDVKNYLPENTERKLAFMPKQESYGKLIVEYTLNQPYESIRDSLFPPSGGPNLDAIKRNSTVEVKGATGTTSGLGFEASVGVPTQSVGIEREGSYKRESEVPIWKYPPGK